MLTQTDDAHRITPQEIVRIAEAHHQETSWLLAFVLHRPNGHAIVEYRLQRITTQSGDIFLLRSIANLLSFVRHP
jgi:hypothetical protein